MQFKPRPYQQRLIETLVANERFNMWAGMGSGKTSGTLAALDILFEFSNDVGPVLVLGPLRVVNSTWPDERDKWDEFKNIRMLSAQAGLGELLSGGDPKTIYLLNYERLPWLHKMLEGRFPFRTVVADESTRLKNFRLRSGGVRSAALYHMVRNGQVKRWINLTGTPSPNGLEDLWGQNFFVDSGQRLGNTFTAFSNRWFRSAPNGFGREPLPNAQKEIMATLEDITCSVKPTDYLNIMAPVDNTIQVTLPDKAMEMYRALEKKMVMDINNTEIAAFTAAALTNKCLQLANGAVYDEDGNWHEAHQAKIEALQSIVEEAAGSPVLVAYHYKSDLARLLKAFPKGKHLDKNASTIKQWNAGKIPILFAHPASAGHGINLQDGGNILVFFSHWWSLEQYQQILERIGPARQAQSGHLRPVYVHHIVAKDTVDEAVILARNSKMTVQEAVLASVKMRLDFMK